MAKFNIDVDKDNNLLIECVFDSKGDFDFDPVDLMDQLQEINISWYVSNIDGWSYLYDSSTDLVYWIDDHWFDKFADLRHTGEARFLPHANTYDDYGGYEWNDDKEWNDIIGR
jgi:hypothetical protein